MNIGLLKEVKADENRVALLPVHIKLLSDSGHQVFVEHDAGKLSGFPDTEYILQGAIVTGKREILNQATLLLKVKAPLESEYDDYRPDHIVFTYFHLDENIVTEKIKKLIRSGFMGIAYEWVTEHGSFPLLEPMSKLSGYLFAQKAVELITHHKGILCGKYEEFLSGANVLIIGLGNIGLSALKFCMDNHLNITLLDKHPDTINQRINKRFGTNDRDYMKIHGLQCIPFDNNHPQATKDHLSEIISRFDIILNCAVRRPDLPKSKLEYLIDKEMVRKLKPNSVICDTTACDMDFIETCISSEELDKTDIIHDVIHYSCDHIPSMVGRTASELLTSQTFRYIEKIAAEGFCKALVSSPALYKGVVCFKNKITHRYIAGKKGFDFYELKDLI